MSNDLTTTNNQLITPPSSQASLLDMRRDPARFPRIGKVTREKAVYEISKIVTQAFLLKGQMADPKNIQFISCSLVDELQADLDNLGTRHISFAEISRIVRRSVLQDEMYGISVSSLYKIIISYVKGEGHRLQEQVNNTPKTNPVMDKMLDAYAAQMASRSKR